MIYEANNTIVNRLVGTTSFRICKVWNPRIDAEASIQVQFFQNGTPYIPPEKWPEGVSEANGILTLTGTGNFCKTFTGLSRYDGEGAEYAYTVEEVNESIQVGDQIYKFNDMLYSV